jgi:hypothetical protein
MDFATQSGTDVPSIGVGRVIVGGSAAVQDVASHVPEDVLDRVRRGVSGYVDFDIDIDGWGDGDGDGIMRWRDRNRQTRPS